MLCIRIGLSLLLCLPALECLAVENLPTVEDVNTLAELSKLTTNGFYQHTFDVRMRHEFAGRFFSEEDRLALYNSAHNSSRQLADFIAKFEDIILRIEQYPHKDWDRIFGRTGLYEKASGCLFSARLNKFGIDYYAVLASDDKEAKGLLQRIDSFSEAQNPFYLQLVRGKVLALLVKTEPNYIPTAERVFSELRERSDTSQRLALLASIEQARCGLTQKDIEANRLAREFIESTLTDDLEVLLPLAFLERRLGLVDAYNDLLQSNPKARSVAADITLGWLEAGRDPVNPLDAALAAEAALRDGPQKHKELLLKLAGENTSASPVIDYAAAVVLADSNELDAVYLLMRAGKVLDAQSADVLGLSAEQIAELAAKLAYRVFVKDPNKCEPATEAFENYFELAGQSADPNLQYVYTQVLTLCGHDWQAVDMLRKIPPSAGDIYSKAQLDLLSARIASGQDNSIFHRTIYGTLFSKYLRDTSDCIYIEPATTLLQSYVEEIEVLQSDLPAYIHTLKDSKKIARFLYDCVQDQSHASILAEFIVLDPNATDEELTEAGELLAAVQNSVINLNTLRVQARLAQRKDDFAAAARLWEQVAQYNETVYISSRSWRWWRAKYYQFECAAEAGNNNADIAHTIDVLQATYKDIPAPWAKNLESLEQNCIQ